METLAREWVNQGVDVTVINPISYKNHFINGGNKAFEVTNGIRVFRPLFFSFSNLKVCGLSTLQLSHLAFSNAALKVCKKIDAADFYYGKFLFPGGKVAQLAGELFQRPSFVDIGESSLLHRLSIEERRKATDTLNKLNGAVCVSDRLVKEVIALGAEHHKVLLAPNSVDKNRFKPMDKTVCRKQLSIAPDIFIVIFVGHFIERKGPLRVLNALKLLRVNVKGVFLGKGQQKPTGETVLFTGSVPNEELPIWLNAADVFVLPTLAEGHCNAINEALACGLPVITSDIPDIRHQINEEAGILVSPQNANEIADAISLLYNNPKLRAKYRQCSIKVSNHAEQNRPKQILEYIMDRL